MKTIALTIFLLVSTLAFSQEDKKPQRDISIHESLGWFVGDGFMVITFDFDNVLYRYMYKIQSVKAEPKCNRIFEADDFIKIMDTNISPVSTYIDRLPILYMAIHDKGWSKW